MANRTATLYIRITTSDGRKSYCTPVYQSKGRLKPQHAMLSEFSASVRDGWKAFLLGSVSRR